MNSEEKISFWPIMITIFLGSFLVMLNTSSINLALPALMKSFSTDIDTVKWTITGFMLSMGTMAPITAYIGERFSYKRIYLISLAAFTLVSILCVFSWNIGALITFRVLQGAFSGIITPATMAMIYQVIPNKRQLTAISIWNLATMLAPAVGPTLSGFLIEKFNWQAIFAVNIPIGLITVIIGMRYIPYYKLSVPKFFDFLGFISILISSLSLLIAFSEGQNWGWGTWKTVSLLIFGIITLGAFIFRELNTDSPVLNIRVFKYSRYTMSIIVSCILNMNLYGVLFITPLFLQNIQHVSPLDTGIILLPASLIMALSMPFVGKIYEFVDTRILISTGISLVALGTWKMTHLVMDISHSYIITWMAVRNLGIALTIMPNNYCGMAILPKRLSGHGSSVNNWMGRVTSSLSMAIFASVLTSRTVTHSSELAISANSLSKTLIADKAFTMAADEVFIIAFIIILIALPFSLFLKKEETTGNRKNNGADTSLDSKEMIA